MSRLLFLILPLLAACHPSPLYVGARAVGTGGEVPRDGNGKPIFSAIRPAPSNAVQSEAPTR